MTEHKNPATSKERGTSWGQNRRLEFIDFRLQWEGQINRSDLTEFFRISIPQASLDLARYQEIAPENLEYDRSEKVYVVTAKFDPLFSIQDSNRYLNSILAVNLEMLNREMSFVGWYPPFAAVPFPKRHISHKILFDVIQAIRKHWTLEIEYQSLSRTKLILRKISPHAIAYDGHRWHTRAYCHENNDFRDFVLARVLAIKGNSPSTVDVAEDSEWHNVVDVILAPHPELSPDQRRIIELDYGMQNGQITVQSKQALLFYLLVQLGLNRKEQISAQAQQIILVNHNEVAQYLHDVV